MRRSGFFPVGADRESESNFQLIAGTNRHLLEAVQAGKFREDLLARINLWTFRLPGLAERREDLEPNLDFELQQLSDVTGHRISMSREARATFLKWAQSSDAIWSGNFRDLNAAVVRMATLAMSGRICEADVVAECDRLKVMWTPHASSGSFDLSALLSVEQMGQLDLFDRLQLEAVVGVCKGCRTLSEAGRKLYAMSRQTRNSTNDADRLRKYLTRFGLSWSSITSASDL